MTKEEVLDIIKQLEKEIKLENEYGCDARYNWPERWERLKIRIKLS